MADVDLSYFSRAVDLYRRDPVSWSILYGGVVVISLFTFGIGLVLVPNAIRATRDAFANDRAPDLARLFQLDQIVDDATVMGAIFLGSAILGSVAGPLGTLVGIALTTAPLAVSEPGVTGTDALNASLAHLQQHPAPVLITGTIVAAINLPGACCLFPLVVTVPITSLALWLFWQDHREAVLALAAPKDG